MIAFLLMLAAHAAPMPLQGLYQFRGNLDPLFRTTIDLLDARRTGDLERLQKLRAQGAECVAMGPQITRCLSHRPPSEIATESLRRLILQNQNLKIEMGAVTSPPAIVRQGDSLIEWQISQQGRSAAGPFVSYRLFEMRGGLQKIAIANAPNDFWFNLDSPLRIRRYDSVTLTENPSRWHTDAVEILLER